MNYLIESPDGTERCLVDSLDGYGGWTVLPVADLGAHRVAALQTELWGAVKAIREAKEWGVAQTPHGPIDANRDSKARIGDAIEVGKEMEGRGFPFADTWTMADNSEVPVDLAVLGDFALALGQHVKLCFARARELRSMIFADGVTIEQLEALNVEEGWP